MKYQYKNNFNLPYFEMSEVPPEDVGGNPDILQGLHGDVKVWFVFEEGKLIFAHFDRMCVNADAVALYDNKGCLTMEFLIGDKKVAELYCD